MAPYIHSKRQGGHIINLEKTVEALEKALPELTKIAANGKKILFVGTKKQLKDATKAAAEAVEMPYVTVRWVGGTLTNVETVNRQIKKLKDPRTSYGFWRTPKPATPSLKSSVSRRKSTS